MSNINQNNYPGVNAVIVGRAAASAENPPYDKEGSRGFQQVRIAVDQGYKKDGEWVSTQTLWITYTARAEELEGVSKGAKVRLDEVKLEAREYTRKDGTTGQAFEARFGEIIVLESGNGGQNTNTQPNDDWSDSDAPF